MLLVAFHAALRGEISLVTPAARPAQSEMDIPYMLLDGLNVRRMLSCGLAFASTIRGRPRGTDTSCPTAGPLWTER
jgi:hypothetical protein